MEEYKEMARLMLKQVEDKPFANTSLRFIATLDGIECDVGIYHERKGRFIQYGEYENKTCCEQVILVGVRGDHSDEMGNIYKYHHLWEGSVCTEDSLAEFLHRTNTILPILKLNKVSGRMMLSNEWERANRLQQLIQLKFEDILTPLTCSVCLEPTETTTICKHLLCVGCYAKMNKRVCPICRKRLQLRPATYHDEDEDDEDN